MVTGEPVHLVDIGGTKGTARTLCGLSTREPRAWPFVSVAFMFRNVLDRGEPVCADCARQLDEGDEQ